MQKKLQMRTDQNLPISKETTYQQKNVSKLPTDNYQNKTEQLEQAFLAGMKLGQALGTSELEEMQCEMQSLKHNMQEIKHCMQETQVDLQEFVQEEVQRDRQLFRRMELILNISMSFKNRVKKLSPMVKATYRYTKRILYVLLGGTLLADVMSDFFIKEVGKEMVTEERFEAMAKEAKRILEPVLEPILNSIWHLVSPIYESIPLQIKTAIALLLIAAMIYHTVSNSPSARDGLDQKIKN